MVFRRKGTARYSFQARTETGRVQLPTGTPSKVLAGKIEAMWEELAVEHRAWDVLNRVLSPLEDLTIGALWDLWLATEKNVPEIRRRLDDLNLEPLVDEFLGIYAKQYPGNAAVTRHRLRFLVPVGQALPRSKVTTAWLTERLYAYEGKAGTLRGVHSAWSTFFTYCTNVKDLFEANPLNKVVPPEPPTTIVRFYEPETVERIIGAQPDAQRRAFYAIAYGAGIESGVIRKLYRSDLKPEDREIHAPGTKTHTRQRMSRVSSWAWPIIWAYAKTLLPNARLFPDSWGPDTVHRWHQETIKALKIPEVLKLHAARHHWAVTHLRAGVPVAVVQAQLGHSTPILTLKTYGAFIPKGDDRKRWEKQVTDDRKRRRAAGERDA